MTKQPSTIRRIRNFCAAWVAKITPWRLRSALSDPNLVSRDFTRKLVLISISLIILVCLGGFFHVQDELTKAREGAFKQLETIASLKTEQITHWLRDRTDDALYLSHTPAVKQGIRALLAQPDSPTAREAVHGWLENIMAGDRYSAVMVYDSEGMLRYSIPENVTGLGRNGQPWVLRALNNPQGNMVDLYREEGSGRIHLRLQVPILQQSVDSTEMRPFGLIVLIFDPAKVLYPIIRSWPFLSASAEVLLVRREGNGIVFLNELRHQSDTALKLRFSVDAPMLPAARALRGETGVYAGHDYRGVDVLTTSRLIPHTPWILLAKVDADEIYGPIRWAAVKSAILFGLLGLTIISVALYVWRQRFIHLLQRSLQAEKEKQELSARLTLLTQQANDIILMLDRSGNIKDANERAVTTYGYTLSELQGLPPGGLRALDLAKDLETQFRKFASAEGGVIETIHQRKDGSTLPVEISGRAVEAVENSILLVIRDVTEQKAHEAEISRLNRLYDVLSQVNQAIVYAKDRESLMHAVCEVLVARGGFLLAWIGWVNVTTNEIELVAQFGDSTHYLDRISVRSDASAEGQGPGGLAVQENCTQLFNEFQTDPRTSPWHEAARAAGFTSVLALPVRQNGTAVGVLLAYADDPKAFGRKEIKLLEEAASDISFGLENLEHEAARKKAEAALSASEDRWRYAVQGSAAGIWETNQVTGEAFYSDRSKSILGYGSDDLPQTMEAWVALIHPDDVAIGQEAMAEHLAGRQPYYEVEHRMRCKDGSYKWISSHAQAVFDDTGRLVRIAGTHLDITHRKRAESALKKSESLFKTIFYTIPDAVNINRLEDGLYVNTNKSFTQLTGYTHEEVIGRTSVEINIWRNPADRLKLVQALKGKGYHAGLEAEFRRKDGSFVTALMSAKIIDLDGVAHILSITRDITESKRITEELRASEEFIRRVLDSSHDCIKILDLEGHLLSMNAGGQRLLEIDDLTPYLNQSWIDFWQGADHTAAQAAVAKAKAGETEIFSGYCETAKGTPKWWEIIISPIYDSSGKVQRLLAISRDITERKKADEILRATLREKEALLKEVHHRVKNNLQVISSLLRLEAGKSNSPATKEVLGDMQGRIRSMALLHETLYRTESFAAVSLGDYLQALATQLFKVLNTALHRVKLDLNLSSGLMVDIDQAIPCGLIVNELLTNALKHGFPEPHTGRVELSFRPLADQAFELVVRDTGVGLPKDFDIGQSKTLGLQLVTDLTRQLQGRLDIGPGATFKLTFRPRTVNARSSRPPLGREEREA